MARPRPAHRTRRGRNRIVVAVTGLGFIKPEGGKHEIVNHGNLEYAGHNPDGTVAHVNTCESFFGLLKRGIFGAWHCVSPEHLQKYTNEFAFRWNTRKMTDGERMIAAIPLIEGKRLTYRQAA